MREHFDRLAAEDNRGDTSTSVRSDHDQIAPSRGGGRSGQPIRPDRRWEPHPKLRFAGDSPVEGDGFEPSVPREEPTRRDGFIRLSSGGSEAHHWRSAISAGDHNLRDDNDRLGWGRRQAQNGGSPDGGPMFRIHLPPADSPRLAQTRAIKVEKPAVPRGCAPLRSAETRSTGRNCANRRRYLCRAIFQYRSAADVIGQPRPSPSSGGVDFSSKAEQGALLVPGQRQT